MRDARFIRYSVLVCTLLFCVDGCDGPRDIPSAFVSRDSAGIRIVESSRPSWHSDRAWQVDTIPLVSVGQLEGDPHYLLDQVTAAIRLTDGKILIANSRGAELLLFDSAGTYLRTIGRRGEGPGEFLRPEHLVRHGDSVAVWDAGLGPISFFDEDLRFVRRVRLEGARLREFLGTGKATESLIPLADGSFISQVTERGAEARFGPNVVFRPPVGFFRFNADLSHVDSLGWYGGLPQMYLNIGGRRVYATVTVPTHAVAAGGGTPLRIYVGNGDPYEIYGFDSGGRLRTLVRRTDPPLPLPRNIEQLIERFDNMNPRSRAERDRVRAAMPRQTHYPAYRRLAVDSTGFLWVTRFDEGADVFDPDGHWLGHVPFAGLILDIGFDYLLTLRWDSLAVERVDLLRLIRRF